MTSMQEWEKTVLASPGAAERVTQIEDELRLAAGLTALREQAGLSQRQLAERIGVRQPRIAAIERSRNVTVDVLERYVNALGGQLELSVIRGGKKTALRGGPAAVKNTPPKPTPRKTAAKTTSSKKGQKTAQAKPTQATTAASVKRTAGKKTA